MRKMTFLGLILSLQMGIASTVHANVYRNLELSSAQEKVVLGVRFTDLAKHTSIIPGLDQKEADELEEKFDRYTSKEYELEKTLNLFMGDYPKTANGSVVLPLVAFGKLKDSGEYAFIQTETFFNGEEFNVQVKNIIPLSQTLFDVNVSLAERKLVLRDNLNSELTMVFPLGVGSFDEGVLNNAVTLLTPRFENAFLDQRAVISERKKPRYFAGKPFIRITTSTNLGEGHTAIGFHVQPNLDTFVRAFDSHGCMRMQLDDLNFLHDIVKEGPHQRLSVNVKFYTEDKIDHPFPKRNKPYKRVLNSRSKENPRWEIDRDGLVLVTKDWENSAPVDQLVDVDGDSHHAVYDYEMAWRKAERIKNIKQECREEFPYDSEDEDLSKRERRKLEKAYEECVKEGQPSRSLRDRIYRWWVH